MDRFHVAGWRRWYLVEPLSEGLTLGTGGLVLMLALAIPAFRETSDDDWLKKSELAVTFLDRYGNEIGSRGIRHNDSIPLDEFPDHLIKATLATEDRRFYDHFGIDIPGMFRACSPMRAPAAWCRAAPRSPSNSPRTCSSRTSAPSSARSRRRSWRCGWKCGCRRTRSSSSISTAPISAAAPSGSTRRRSIYFNKSARDVNLPEAAMLAGLFKAPSKFAPHVNLPAARARANVVLDNLVEAGFMTEGQVFGARRNPATAVDRRDERSPNYYLDWAFDEMKKLVDTLPKSVHERVFVARLAIDLNLQNNTEQAVENSLRQYGREYHAKQAAAVLMETDGAVRAMVGGRDYGESQFNRATDATAPAGLLVQALCLRDRADERLQADLDRGRFAGLHRQLVPEELLRRLFRLDDADAGDHPLDQRHSGEALDRARQGQSQDRPRHDQRDGAQGRPAHAASRHAVDADRRRRGDRARPHRRLRHVRQSTASRRPRTPSSKSAPAPAS